MVFYPLPPGAPQTGPPGPSQDPPHPLPGPPPKIPQDPRSLPRSLPGSPTSPPGPPRSPPRTPSQRPPGPLPGPPRPLLGPPDTSQAPPDPLPGLPGPLPGPPDTSQAPLDPLPGPLPGPPRTAGPHRLRLPERPLPAACLVSLGPDSSSGAQGSLGTEQAAGCASPAQPHAARPGSLQPSSAAAGEDVASRHERPLCLGWAQSWPQQEVAAEWAGLRGQRRGEHCSLQRPRQVASGMGLLRPSRRPRPPAADTASLPPRPWGPQTGPSREVSPPQGQATTPVLGLGHWPAGRWLEGQARWAALPLQACGAFRRPDRCPFSAARIIKTKQWCDMLPCLEGEGCDLLINRSGWTCTQPGGRIKTTTVRAPQAPRCRAAPGTRCPRQPRRGSQPLGPQLLAAAGVQPLGEAVPAGAQRLPREGGSDGASSQHAVCPVGPAGLAQPGVASPSLAGVSACGPRRVSVPLRA
ncbi:Chemokine-like protein TAFA-5 [Galemys pyrenaicus]|uniref:Chemokine-like protein TAFA-5 n=1 Tax=Galemys pyrenaicus TaxID=202257 RepID=A0A8J6AAM8_GALPY|nr:Chemokine-like protein TAFA-5 [Galemys pyrenaicus]